MKKILSVILLLFTALVFSQPDKDSLLQKNFNEVHDKLKLMSYLDGYAGEYYKMTEKESRISEATFQYYLKKNVISNNPIPDIDILRYLGFYTAESIPANWETFRTAVYNSNAKSLLEISEKYGFPSAQRILKIAGGKSAKGGIVFTIRRNRYTDELKKMMRQQYRKKNVSEAEYTFFKSFSEYDALSSEEIKKLEKKGIKMVFEEKE
ncbi:hypothetical protein D3C87_405130 [compost metagenome]